MRFGLLGLAAASLAVAGCAVAPHGRGGQSVTHDVVDYLHREWPLHGPQTMSPDACAGCGSGPCEAPCEQVYADDWDQPGILPAAKGYSDDPPPAVPLEMGGPGRFHPVPTRPAFAPQGPAVAGFGAIAEPAANAM